MSYCIGLGLHSLFAKSIKSCQFYPDPRNRQYGILIEASADDELITSKRWIARLPWRLHRSLGHSLILTLSPFLPSPSLGLPSHHAARSVCYHHATLQKKRFFFHWVTHFSSLLRAFFPPSWPSRHVRLTIPSNADTLLRYLFLPNSSHAVTPQLPLIPM